MMRWFRQHFVALADAFRHLRRRPGSFSLNVLVVAIALSLPFAGLTVLENIRPVSEQLAVEPEISLFMTMDTPREQALALGPKIRRILQDDKISAKLEFTPSERALTLLKNRTGLSDAIAALGENPLPDGYVLKLSGFQNASEANRIDKLATQLQALPNVEHVQVDSAWVKRLAALMHVLLLALLFLGATLGAVVVAVIFNTIRLQVMTQEEEIKICRLFGATDTFICRPFYYTGTLLGLFAGLIALLMATFALQPLNDAIAEFARLYAAEFRIAPLGLIPTAVFLVISAFLGLTGAALSIKRHVARLA